MENIKSLLKDGMVVELRNGCKCIVIDDKIMNINSHDYLDYYDDNLISKLNLTHLDIMKIYKLIDASNLRCVLGEGSGHYNLKIVWEREEPVEMTLEEVCKALGKDIKIVKEH